MAQTERHGDSMTECWFVCNHCEPCRQLNMVCRPEWEGHPQRVSRNMMKYVQAKVIESLIHANLSLENADFNIGIKQECTRP